MIKKFRFITLALSVMLCLSAMAFGQETQGTIEGNIKDATGGLVPGATITVESIGSTAGFSRTITTDDEGYFIIPRIPPGNYKITISADGFQTLTRNANVVLGKAIRIDDILAVTGAVGDVTITGADSAVNIDPRDTKIDTNITREIFEELPKGTQFSSLLKIAPNVRPEPLAAGFQIDGASGAENVFVVDGQEVTNFRTGQLNTNNNLPFELLQEVQIKSTGFEAEFGGATGGVINVVTIGGNNELHGNFGISFEAQNLQGDPRPSLNRFGNGADDFEFFNPAKTGGTAFFPVANITGPIVKDKLWFSAIYAPQIYEFSQNVPFFTNGIRNNVTGILQASNDPRDRVFVENQGFQFKRKIEEAFIRLDAQPTSRLRVYGTFLYNPIIDQGALPGTTSGFFNSTSAGPFVSQGGILRTQSSFLSEQGGRQNSNTVNGQATYTATNNLVLNFRGGRSFLNEKLGSYGVPNEPRVLCSLSGDPAVIPGGEAAAGCTRGSSNFSSNFGTNFDVSTRTTFDADASLVGINLGGRHNFKFGYQYNGLSNEVDQGYRDTGVVILYYGLDISNLTGQAPTAGNLGSGIFQRFATLGAASSASNSLFAQDSWQIANRLTLNLGVRIEKETVPSFSEQGQAIEFGFGDKIAPRFGIAYDLTGDGKTKLFASYGWFYDRFKYELPRGSFGGDFFRRDYFEILPASLGGSPNFSFYTPARILGGRADQFGGDCPIVGGPGLSRCQFDFRIPTNLVGGDIFDSGGVDPDIKAARQSEYTIGVERELFRNTLLAARYTHKQLDRTVEDVGVFNAQGSEAYIIGNPGFGLTCDISTDAGRPCTEAVREYDAFEIRVDKRASNWFANASYTYSKLFGNYSGLASSDEFGRSSPNVNRFFDLPFLGYTAAGEPDLGRLATDRPHVFKAFGGYSFRWDNARTNETSVSAFTTIQSGTPLTTIYSLYSVTSAILFERGDLGRTPRFTETDLSVSHTYKFGRDNKFGIEPYVSIRNLFDEDNVLGVDTTIGTVNFSGSSLRAGGCPTTVCGLPTSSGGTQENAVIDAILLGNGIQQFVLNYLNNPTRLGTSSGLRNTYGQPNNYQAPREVRFGARFTF